MSTPTSLDPKGRFQAALTLLLSRVVYAFNWYNIGAVLPLIGRNLGASTFQLGIVLGAFLVGAGVFQVPAGLAALRWGNRAVSLFSLVLMGGFSLASAFAPNWPTLAAFRFGAGAGAAFFFAPALGLVTSYFPTGTRGPIIGVYNAGFSIGSGIGLLGGAVIGAAYGWPFALAVGGVVLMAMAAIAPLGLPRTGPRPERRPLGRLWESARPIFTSRSIWALSVGTSGLWGALYAAAQYFTDFAHAVHPVWSVALAAGIPTLMIVFEVPGGPFGGWIGERAPEMRRILLGWGVAAGLAILVIPFLPFAGLVPLFAFLGFADGVVFAVIYLIPSYLPESHGESLALGLAFVNTIQIFLGSAIAILFGYLAGTYGYSTAWWFAAVVSLVPLPLLLWISRRRGEVEESFVRPRARRPRIATAPDRPT